MSIKMVELEEASAMKQGIVTILRSDFEGYSTKSAASIRRTLSADMSCKKWLSQNGFFFTSPIKKNVSSQVLNDVNIPSQDDVWRSIQSKKNNETMNKPAVWGDILSTNDKNKDCSTDNVYVHPLLKKRSLSEKSLEICTESLGSETGSDVFSNSGVSSDADDDLKERVMVEKEFEFKEMNNQLDDLHVVKYKKSPVRPFPPPLPSIGGGDGVAPSLHMHSRRENGRLVVEAVSVPPKSNFHAQRRNGRLVLTLINEGKKVESLEKVSGDEEEVDGGGGGDDVAAAAEKFVVEQKLGSLPSGVVMKKLMAFGNKNQTWSNKAVNVMAAAAEEKLSIPHSLPPWMGRLIPSPPPPAVALFNMYEYSWRNKTTVSGGGFITTQQSTVYGGGKTRRNQDLVVMKGNKGDYFVGCKEQKRSLAIWEPYCIATS